ncbi:hypothetical protein ACIOHC_30740 [Streptomyces sp. NPDC088252]|uniref:hypothetical protein n=1 Tax=unclassified Streptomyces TaxID=2593676 RepID=UPI0038045B64
MTTAEQPQGQYHFVLTVQKPSPGGYIVADWSGSMTPEPGWTRHDTYQAIRAEHVRQRPDMANAVGLFFSLEPNQL